MTKLRVFITSALLFLLTAGPAGTAMQSENYVIYENINHAFDGPVISNVAHTVDGQSVTVTWNTNVAADSFVVYSLDSGTATSSEQGTSVKNYTSHSVDLSGLSANTVYYYQVRSERVNGGITTDGTINTFTTGEDVSPDPPTTGGGGGLLIIDKTDKFAPVISDLSVNEDSVSSIEINWTTDEPATSFVEYGPSSNYGSVYGQWSSTTEHSVLLEGLQSSQQYHFRALSSDDWGNVARSENRVFTTTEGELPPEEVIPEPEPGTEPEPEPEPTPEDPGLISEAARRALELLGRILPQVSLNEIGDDEIGNIESLEDLAGIVPAPVLSGEPRVDISATEATIAWTTDVDSNSLVALAPESRYNPGADEPYQQITGNPDEEVQEHTVTLYSLQPNTTYHYQLRSKSKYGPTATSRDFQFTTSIEDLSITSFVSQIVDNETATFRWVTNKESDSSIKFAPYHGNIVALDQSKTIKDNAHTVIHEITISEFIAGTFYDIEFISTDDKGNIATEILNRFSTTEDDFPPEVSHIKADSTVFVDRGNKIQTIISWLTNEPSTSRVLYQEGVHGSSVELSDATALNTNYTKEHVMVITKFKPGIVYSFRVESVDSGGNVTLSKTHTFMTAKKKESIIQIIMRILEDTFGWIKKLM